MGRASTRLHTGLPGKGLPKQGGPLEGAVLETALPDRGLPGERDPLAEARDRFLAAEPVDRVAVTGVAVRGRPPRPELPGAARPRDDPGRSRRAGPPAPVLAARRAADQ